MDSTSEDEDYEETIVEARTPLLKCTRVATKLYSKNFAKEIRVIFEEAPIIIAMKGDPSTGRKLVAFYVASILRCPLIKEHDFNKNNKENHLEEKQLWRKICNLAISQLTSGRSVVIDTELGHQNEFEQLKELSERTKTPLAVFECRVDNAEKFWNSMDGYGGQNDPVMFIFTEFMEKQPASQYNVNSTNFDMDETPRILVEIETLGFFKRSVSNALMDLLAHIFPNFESRKANGCDHIFQFIIIEDIYKRPCCNCSQLVSGSVYRCRYCRFIVHKTCNSFPENLMVDSYYSFVSLKLRHVPELIVDASCSCCKQLLRSSTSSRYYCSEDGLFLFDFDCLFLLPAKLRTKFHKHELLRTFQSKIRSVGEFSIKWCKECEASINQETILYFCPECYIPFDIYCLWLPERVKFNRHKHLFQLSVIPRVDPYPHYCEVCQNERDTEHWIYYCAECDYPIHPRCTGKAPCLPRYISTEISTTYKNWKKNLTETKFHRCSSHLSFEGVMKNELLLQHRSEAKELHFSFKESRKDIESPIIVITKGHSYTGRKLVAFTLAAALDCLLIDEDNQCEVTNTANEPKQDCYQEFSRIILSQLQIGLSVVIDSDLLHESGFFTLRDFAIANETPLFIVECTPCNEYELWHNTFPNLSLENFRRTISSCSDYEYDVGDTPKVFVNVTTPTFDGIKKSMPQILDSISNNSKEWSKKHIKEPEITSCYRHYIELGRDYDVLEDDICNRCSKKLLTPILKCSICRLVLHRTCSKLPLRILTDQSDFNLEKYGDDNVKVRCACCKELVKDYVYNLQYRQKRGDSFICLDCLFTPPKPRINLHKHPLGLYFINSDFQCRACGRVCKQMFSYRCSICEFNVSIRCGWLAETVFDRHCHPFYLAVSPEHVSNQYYCEFCQEERDKRHWVYCCIGCDYFIHIHCLVPTGGCPPSEL